MQKGIHRIVFKLPNDAGYVGHLSTHLIVELSANLPPVQPDWHFLRLGSAYKSRFIGQLRTQS